VTGLEVWLRAAAALALIALVLGSLKYLLRRLSTAAWPRGRRRMLDVVETLPLAGAVTLHVVRVAGRYFALAGGQGQVRVVCEVPAEALRARHDDEARTT